MIELRLANGDWMRFPMTEVAEFAPAIEEREDQVAGPNSEESNESSREVQVSSDIQRTGRLAAISARLASLRNLRQGCQRQYAPLEENWDHLEQLIEEFKAIVADEDEVIAAHGTRKEMDGGRRNFIFDIHGKMIFTGPVVSGPVVRHSDVARARSNKATALARQSATLAKQRKLEPRMAKLEAEMSRLDEDIRTLEAEQKLIEGN